MSVSISDILHEVAHIPTPSIGSMAMLIDAIREHQYMVESPHRHRIKSYLLWDKLRRLLCQADRVEILRLYLEKSRSVA